MLKQRHFNFDGSNTSEKKGQQNAKKHNYCKSKEIEGH